MSLANSPSVPARVSAEHASAEPAPNRLSGVPLDRVAGRRTDAAWVAQAAADPASRVVPVSGGRVLVAEDAGGAELPADTLAAFATPSAAAARARVLTVAEFTPVAGRVDASGAERVTALLGVGGGAAHFAVDVPAELADALVAAAGPGARWSELRPAALALPEGEAALVAYARAMVWWHARHGFCGVCGASTRVEEAGHVRACTRCDARHFPRTDPAVIVLITHRPDGAGREEEACLLGNAPAWPAAMYSTLAGFVEPGESLEDTVRREMHEEAGVEVDAVRYGSSQPWPFPQSLMLGFTATARDRTLRLDAAELRDARWFTRAALDAALADGSVWIPPRLSISRRLIEDWRNEPAPTSASG